MKAFVLALLAFITMAAAPPRFSKGNGPDNLGIVVANEQFTIYRSAELGDKGLERVDSYLDKHGLRMPKTVIYMNRHGYRYVLPYPSHFAIQEYRAADVYGFEFFHPFRYDARTYLDGTNPYAPRDDIDKRFYLTREARELFGFREDHAKDGGMDSFYRILDLILTGEQPVLFHCTGGHHRSGIIGMAIRYLQGGAWREGRYRANTIGRDKYLNAAQYEYFLHNRVMFRQANLDFIERWAAEPRFLEYQRRYQRALNLPERPL